MVNEGDDRLFWGVIRSRLPLVRLTWHGSKWGPVDCWLSQPLGPDTYCVPQVPPKHPYENPAPWRCLS